MFFVLVLFSAISSREVASLETKVVTTNTGRVQGVVEQSSISGKYVQKFSNIPYAEAPIGKLRFAKPEPKKPWNGTLKSTNETIACMHHPFLPSEPIIPITEDCLILNVWTPQPAPNESLSVMVWFHGGSYIWGDADSYPGHNFVAVGNVILVTVNYRLSALGFLSSGDGRIKGNFGLFDQRLAMKWVKENIASFGGDPQSITIFGESAGGSSVSAHTMSSGSWPYFNKAVFQSGVITMSWAVAANETAMLTFDSFLQVVNCTDDENVLDCLRNNVSTSDMVKVYRAPFPSPLWFAFAPVVDGEFLESDPKTLWQRGRVKNSPVLLGVQKDDAFPFVQDLLKISRNISFFQEELEKQLTAHFSNSPPPVVEKALALYKPECVPSFIEAVRPLVNFNSDTLYICDTVNEATLRSQKFNNTNVYLYQYSFVSLDQTPRPYPVGMYSRGTFGFAAHGFDVPSLFGFRINDPEYLPEEQILSMRMILYWTNFAKNSDPNIGTTTLPIVWDGIDSLPEWPKFTNSTREYLDMENLSRMVVSRRLREKYCEFLKDPESFIVDKPTTTEASKHTTTPRNGAAKKIRGKTILLVILVLSYIMALNF